MESTFRATCRMQFTKLYNSIMEYLKNMDEDKSNREEITVFLQRLKNSHQRLSGADQAVKPTLKPDDMPREFESTTEYDDKAVSLIARLEFLLLEGNSKTESSGNDSRLNKSNNSEDDGFMGVRLKSIELKQFDGDFENWLPFWEQFKRVVHNNNKIPAATKFSYLSQSLIGNAATTITGFTPSEKCYEDAISLLQEQYGNSEKIVEKYVQKLLDTKAVLSPSDLKGLRSLYNEVTATIRTLSALQVASSQYAIIIKSIILKCLPSKLRIEFHKGQQVNTLSTSTHIVIDATKTEGKEELENLLAFIKIEVEALEKAKMSEIEHKKSDESSTHKKTMRGTAVGLLTSSNGNQKHCLFCKSAKHNTHVCDSDMSIDQRKLILQKEGRCYRCTGKNHTSKFCKSQWVKCERCKGRHITALHEEGNQNKQRNQPYERANQTDKHNNEQATLAVSNSQNATATLSASNNNNKIYLQTAKTILYGENNDKKLLTRIIMDNGSQRTYISEKVANELELSVIGEEISRILTFGEIKNKQMTKMKKVKVNVKSQYNNNYIEIIAIVVPRICANILPVPNENNLRINHLDLAEKIVCDENVINGINMLIGQDNYWKFCTFESKLINENFVAVKTFFGWTIQGGSSESNENEYALSTLYERVEDFELSKFWSLESIGINAESSTSVPSVDINFANGRYEVSLPWKISNKLLNDNKSVAINRLNGLTRKLMNNKSKLEQYHAGIQELLNNGAAEKVSKTRTENPVYYMPHRPVYRNDKLTTKMRIVFDASSSEPELLSLNEHLSAGENLVADLLTSLIRFRSNKIAITADIEKAFLQISLKQQERDAHRFLWYDALPSNLEGFPNIVEYRMSRVTFGVTSSPYLLAATINKHLNNMADRYGLICEKLRKSFYVDDLILSMATLHEAEYLVQTASEIMKAASFNLRKWSTNDCNLKQKFKSYEIDQPTIQKVLGINWCVLSDVISVDLKPVNDLIIHLRPTKRNITKAMAKVYDPLGILGPFTVRIKLLLQSAWKAKVPWDQTLSEYLASEFQIWREELPLLSDMAMQRCLTNDKTSTNQLHIFADASLQAYGVVAYIRAQSLNGKVNTNFVCSKNRVSPINNQNQNELTLPKFELTAALLASRLKKFILTSIDCKIESVHLWSDSTIALDWILGYAKAIKPYVTPRVKEINNLTNIYDWQHCNGKSNPADLLTRGIKATHLLQSELWKHGPSWLSEPQNEWPKTKFCLSTIHTTPTTTTIEEKITQKELILKIENFSKLQRLIRTTAYVLRFVDHIKGERVSTTKRRKGIKPISCVEELTANELKQAQMYWIQQQQQHFFSAEISSIQRTGEVHKTSKIYSLNPILTNNVLRVRTRIPIANNEDFYNSMANPIILPKHSWLSLLIIRDAHKETLHGGVNMVFTFIRKTYWIVQGRQLIKSILHQCIICKRIHGKCGSEPWVVLPIERVRASKPFETTGVDFAGPLYVKDADIDQLKKTYIMLFTCASIRAVHLELVENMSVKSCIEALRRFIARRGIPNVIMSDNAKTFKRADTEISKLFKFTEYDKIQQFSAHKGITWKYIPERAAWWGGFWERLVRSVKTAIKSAIGKELLTISELTTFLSEVESIVNDRPLTYISSDEKDLQPLTPSHFLHCGNSVLPNTNFNFEIEQKSLSRSWQLRQTLMKRYLKRWHDEYLSQLRSIHHNKGGLSRSIKTGDIVLLQEDLKSRLLWKMAVVETAYPGRDGRVRSCNVRLANNNVLKRPIQLLIPLEISSSMAGAEDVENIN